MSKLRNALSTLFAYALVLSLVPCVSSSLAFAEEAVDELGGESPAIEQPIEVSESDPVVEEMPGDGMDDGQSDEPSPEAEPNSDDSPTPETSSDESTVVDDENGEPIGDVEDGAAESESVSEEEQTEEEPAKDTDKDKLELDAEAEKKGTPVLSATAHVQTIGWQPAKGFGEVIGTSGKSLRVEGLKLSIKGENVPSGSIEYQTHVQNIGWQSWVRDGALAGTTGKSYRIEALKVRLSGDLAKEYDIYYQVHAQNVGWMGLAKNGEPTGTSGHSYRLEAVRIWLVKKGSTPPKTTVSYTKSFLGIIGLQAQAHVQTIGWMPIVGSGSILGTTGRSLRLEAMTFSISGYDIQGGIQYRSHIQKTGWQGWVKDGQISGTSGRGLRVEAFQAKLTGDMAKHYDLYYRAHVSNVGWLGWAKNGESAGSTGLSLRVEAIQVQLVTKGGSAPSSSSSSYSAPLIAASDVTYAAWVQGSSSWQASVSNGKTAGTTGKALRVEALKFSVSGPGNGITYRAHIQNTGWGSWASNGATVGKGGSGRRVEAIQIKLTGTAANIYDVYYRAHVSGYGWLGWTKNGSSAGSIGLGKPIEAVQVKLVPKGNGAPGSTSNPCMDYDAVGKKVVSVARSQLGAAYTEENDYYAEGGPFNCSGFTYFCYLKAGFVIPRKQGYYSYYWNENNKEYSQMWWVEKRGNWTTDVSQLKPGDLVFFSPINDKYHTGHVGVYIGGGQMIDAYPGYGVSIRGVLQSGFVGGGNPIF